MPGVLGTQGGACGNRVGELDTMRLGSGANGWGRLVHCKLLWWLTSFLGGMGEAIAVHLLCKVVLVSQP